MAQTERATEDMSKNWEDRVAESKKDVKVDSFAEFLSHRKFLGNRSPLKLRYLLGIVS